MKHQSATSGDETVKETLESIVIAFILAFVFRAYVVEAFVIPTGSMAPTLLGRHLLVQCPQCGYRFAADVPRSNGEKSSLVDDKNITCPMCHYPQALKKGTSVSAGDRILVHKYIYSLVEPERWDVVVFKAPIKPDMNYIKRLVGLPGEDILIIEGNIYTKAIDADEQAWAVARKTSRPRIQETVWQPIFHSYFVPLDGGKDSPGRTRHPWHAPWTASNTAVWEPIERGGFRHGSSDPGKLSFDFRVAGIGGPGSYAYNQLIQARTYNQVERWSWAYEPVEDVRLVARFVPDTEGLGVTLRTTARVDDPAGRPLRVVANITPGGLATLSTVNINTNKARQLGDPVDIGPFTAGQSTQVELWYVDQEVSLWVEGERVFAWGFDLPVEVLKNRRAPTPTPDISIDVQGAAVSIPYLAVDRDIYYAGQSPSGATARGAVIKTPEGARGASFRIEKDQFFCLGDNSPLSHDSRYWNKLDPWIERRMFTSDGPQELKLGIVPRKLMLGRAFFVYFPAPLKLTPTAPGVFPNFGDMRFIH